MPEPIYYSRCEADDSFLNPVIGDVLTKLGTPTYSAAKFDNGVDGVDGAQWFKKPYLTLADNSKGCFEFWWKPGANFATVPGWLFSWDTTPSTNGYPAVHFTNHTSGPRFWCANRGGISVLSYNHPNVNYGVGTLVHHAMSFDVNGIDGGAKTCIAFVNGIEVASSTTAYTPTTAHATRQDIAINGIGVAPTLEGQGVVDNVKIYDFAKTDFSNIEAERDTLNDANILL